MHDAQSRTQLVKGLLETIVLHALSHEDDYCYSLFNQVTSALKKDSIFLRWGSFYPLLHRLESKGLLKSYAKPGRRGTARRYYHITRTGRMFLKDRLEDWGRVVRIVRNLK